MHIALTGATGYLGACLAVGFLARGHRVTCLSRRDPKGSRTRLAIEEAWRGFGLDDGGAPPDIHVVPWEAGGDPTAAGLAGAQGLEPIDAIWHCAAHMSLSTSQLAFAHEVNVRGTLALHRALSDARGQDARFYYVSTAYVGGFAPGVVPEDLVLAPKLESSYLVTKWGAELALAHAARSPGGSPLCIIRPTLVGAHTETAWYGGKPFGIHMYLAALVLMSQLGLRDLRLDLPAEALHNYLPIDDFVGNAAALLEATVDSPVFVGNDIGTDVSTRAVVEPTEETLRMRIDYGAPRTMGDRVLDAMTRVAKPIAGTGNFAFADERFRAALGEAHRRTEVTPARLRRFVTRYLDDTEASLAGSSTAQHAQSVGALARALDGVSTRMLPESARADLAERFVRRVLRPGKRGRR